jgi:hypothetical protein
VQPVDRREKGDDGTRFCGTGEHDFAQDRPTVDIQVVKGIPGPLHPEVLVEHQDHFAGVVSGGAVDINGSLGPREHDGVPVGQPLHVVVEAVDGLVAQGGQLGVHGREIRLANGVSGQVDLPQDVAIVPDRVAVIA